MSDEPKTYHEHQRRQLAEEEVAVARKPGAGIPVLKEPPFNATNVWNTGDRSAEPTLAEAVEPSDHPAPAVAEDMPSPAERRREAKRQRDRARRLRKRAENANAKAVSSLSQEQPMEDWDDEAETARIAEEKADAEFRLKLEQAERLRREEVARRSDPEAIREAMRLIETADPATLFNLRCQEAVTGTRLIDQRASPPSLGTLPPGQAETVKREQASAEQAHRADLAAQERWRASRQAQIEDLCSAQSPANQAHIRAVIKSQG